VNDLPRRAEEETIDPAVVCGVLPEEDEGDEDRDDGELGARAEYRVTPRARDAGQRPARGCLRQV
jgi:hypothetical protein